jgi:hypothetical protein
MVKLVKERINILIISVKVPMEMTKVVQDVNKAQKDRIERTFCIYICSLVFHYKALCNLSALSFIHLIQTSLSSFQFLTNKLIYPERLQQL